MKQLTIEELKNLQIGDWVWVILIEENRKGYAEIKSLSDDEIELHANFFWAFLDLSDYGKTWLAYKNKEQAEAKGEIVELPCKVGDTVYRWLYGNYDEFTVSKINFERTKNEIDYCLCVENEHGLGEYFYKNDEGYDWFLTKESVERRLAELKGDKK